MTKGMGFGLITLGMIVMTLAALSIFGVCIRKIQPIQMFHFEALSIDMSQYIPSYELPPELQGLVKTNNEKPKKTELLSAALVNETSNFFAHILLMGFFVNVGFKIAMIGVPLLQPIIVKVAEKKIINAIQTEQNSQERNRTG